MMIRSSTQRLSRQNIRVRLIKLALFSAPLVSAYFYGYTNQSSPLFCPFRYLTGIPCPGCGLTRSFMAIATGNISLSLDYHLFGLLVFLGLLIGSIHLWLEIVTRRKITTFYQKILSNNPLKLWSIPVIIIYHGMRLYPLAISGELMMNWQQSPLGKLF